MEKIRTWQERTGNHNIRPGSVKHMIAEIADLRAALARAGSAAPTGQQAEPVTCRGCDPAEGFCRACREAERAALAAPTAAEGPSLPENWQNDVQTAWRCVRKYNNTIPDATLDLMRDMLLAAPLPTKEGAGEVDAKDAAVEPTKGQHEAALRFLEQKAVEFARQFGSTDTQTGFLYFKDQDHEDLYDELQGRVDARRAMLAAIAAQPKDTTDTRRDA